jgi:hypothetical protein
MAERKIFNSQLWNEGTQSSYVVVPGLCPNCKHFSVKNDRSSDRRYSCTAGSTASSAYKAGCAKEKGLEFDNCNVYVKKPEPSQQENGRSKTNTNKGGLSPKLTLIIVIIAVPIAIINTFIMLIKEGNFWALGVLIALIIGIIFFIKRKFKK